MLAAADVITEAAATVSEGLPDRAAAERAQIAAAQSQGGRGSLRAPNRQPHLRRRRRLRHPGHLQPGSPLAQRPHRLGPQPHLRQSDRHSRLLCERQGTSAQRLLLTEIPGADRRILDAMTCRRAAVCRGFAGGMFSDLKIPPAIQGMTCGSSRCGATWSSNRGGSGSGRPCNRGSSLRRPCGVCSKERPGIEGLMALAPVPSPKPGELNASSNILCAVQAPSRVTHRRPARVDRACVSRPAPVDCSARVPWSTNGTPATPRVGGPARAAQRNGRHRSCAERDVAVGAAQLAGDAALSPTRI